MMERPIDKLINRTKDLLAITEERQVRRGAGGRTADYSTLQIAGCFSGNNGLHGSGDDAWRGVILRMVWCVVGDHYEYTLLHHPSLPPFPRWHQVVRAEIEHYKGKVRGGGQICSSEGSGTTTSSYTLRLRGGAVHKRFYHYLHTPAHLTPPLTPRIPQVVRLANEGLGNDKKQSKAESNQEKLLSNQKRFSELNAQLTAAMATIDAEIGAATDAAIATYTQVRRG